MGDVVTNALSVRRKDSHTYLTHVDRDHRFGEFVHGGFAATLMVYTVLEHLKTTLGRKTKQHVTGVHVEYLRPVNGAKNELQIEVQDSKVGKAYSTFHVILSQKSKPAMTAYINVVDATADKGVTFDTEYALHPPPPPFDPAELDEGPDPTYVSYVVPPGMPDHIHPLSHWKFAFEKHGPLHNRIADKWISSSDPNGRITTIMLPMVADTYLRMIYNFLPNDSYSHAGIVRRTENKSPDGYIRKEDLLAHSPKFWSATHLLFLEIVQQLPDEGVEWLFVRVEAKTMRNGRLPGDVTIINREGQIIATGHVTDFMLPTETRMPEAKRASGGRAKI